MYKMYFDSPYFSVSVSFFFSQAETPATFALSLHDALPISTPSGVWASCTMLAAGASGCGSWTPSGWRRRNGTSIRFLDRKSTRLNSSHPSISYAVFCLKKKKKYLKVKNVLAIDLEVRIRYE